MSRKAGVFGYSLAAAVAVLAILQWLGSTSGAAWLAIWLALALAVLAATVYASHRLEGTPRATTGEARLVAALDQVSDAYLVFDADDKLVAANRQFAQMFDPDAAPGRIGITFREMCTTIVNGDSRYKDDASRRAAIERRMQLHRNPGPPFEYHRVGGGWLRITERRLADGGTVITYTDITEAKRREAEIAASDQRFRAFADIASDWLWETDAKHRYTFFSPNAEVILGRPNRDRIGQSREEFLRRHWKTQSAEEAELFRRHLDDLAAHRPFRNLVHSYFRADGQVRMVSVSANPVRSPSGEFRGYRGVGHDVTELVALTKQAETAHQRLVQAIETLDDAFALYDAGDRLVTFNRRFREMAGPELGASVREGRSFEEILRDAVVLGIYPQADGREEQFVLERVAAHRAGRGQFVERFANKLWLRIDERRTPDGGMVWIGTDVSALVEREAELARQSKIQRALLDNIDLGISLIDSNLQVIAYNERLRALLDFPTDLLKVGMPLEDLFRFNAARGEYGPGDSEHQVALRLALARLMQPHAFERTRPDGTVLEIRGQPLPGGGFVTTYTDVTHFKRAESELRSAREQAESASHSKSMFLANMSHELRTPLNAVIGFAEIIQGEVVGPLGSPAYKEYANDIVASARHLGHVIGSILDLSKIEAGRMKLEETVISLDEAADAATRLLRSRATEGRIRLETRIPASPPRLLADSRALQQMLVNLLANAVKFTPVGGDVILSVELAADGGLVWSVRDTGIGIDAEDQARIFEPFTQVESSLTRRHDGTGLGLPLVRALIELHGGQVRLESQRGRGTQVTLHFPPERTIRSEARAVKAS